jgi:hypothetical protein
MDTETRVAPGFEDLNAKIVVDPSVCQHNATLDFGIAPLEKPSPIERR